jgi:predicted ferric reductase
LYTSIYMAIIYVLIGITMLPFLWLFTQPQILNNFNYTLGNIAGFLGAIMLLWQFALGIRGIATFFTKNYVSLIKVHIVLGVYGMIFILLHPILELFMYGSALLLPILPTINSEFSQQLFAGKVAFFFIALIWVSSAFIRKNIKYSWWYNVHLLSYPAMALVFAHASSMGTFLATFPTIKMYWFLLGGVWAGIVIYRVLAACNVFNATYTLTSKETKSDGITLYTFAPNGKKLICKPGQFFYIKPSFFSAPHPFSVAKCNADGSLTFGIKAIGTFTKQLENITLSQTTYIEGPYGVFTQEGHNNKPKVIFAGGIGVTPFVQLIKDYGSTNTYMFYCNKELQNAILREEFANELGSNYIEVVSKDPLAQAPIIQGRITDAVIAQKVPKEILSAAQFFICGSPSFMSGTLDTLKKLSIPKSRIFMEEFGY